MCDITPGHVIAVWGAGPVGQFAIASARLLGAERVIAIDRLPYRLQMAREKAGATDAINYEQTDVYEMLQELTAGRGPDACIDAVGLEAHSHGPMYAVDRTKQALMLESDRPLALRQAIRCCKNGGVVSVSGVYGGFIDHFPMGAIVNRALTIRSGQCHVHRYLKPLLARIEQGEIDPSFIITHRLPLAEAASAFDMFLNKTDGCEKVVLKAAERPPVRIFEPAPAFAARPTDCTGTRHEFEVQSASQPLGYPWSIIAKTGCAGRDRVANCVERRARQLLRNRTCDGTGTDPH